MKSRVPIIALIIILVLQLVDVGIRFAGGGTPWLGLGVLALTIMAIGGITLRKPN